MDVVLRAKAAADMAADFDMIAWGGDGRYSLVEELKQAKAIQKYITDFVRPLYKHALRYEQEQVNELLYDWSRIKAEHFGIHASQDI